MPNPCEHPHQLSHCIVLYCIVLYCIVLYCIVLCSLYHTQAVHIPSTPTHPSSHTTLSLQNYELLLQGKNEEVAFAEASLVEIQNLFDEARRGLPQSQGVSRSGVCCHVSTAVFSTLRHAVFFSVDVVCKSDVYVIGLT